MQEYYILFQYQSVWLGVHLLKFSSNLHTYHLFLTTNTPNCRFSCLQHQTASNISSDIQVNGSMLTHMMIIYHTPSDSFLQSVNLLVANILSWLYPKVRDWDWDKFIQNNMTLYRCMISDIHDSSYVLFSTNLISNTSLHVGRPLLRPFLVAYAEATLARQKKIAQQTKSVDIISEYLLRTNGQLFEMNVKIVSSYWQAGKAFDPLQHN